MLNQNTPAIDKVDRKLAFSFGALTLFLLLVVTIASSIMYIKLQSREADRLSGALARILGESIEKVSFSGTYHARLFVEEIKSKTPEIEAISVESRDGRVIAHSDPSRNDSAISAEDLEMLKKCLTTKGTVVSEGKSPKGKALKIVVLPYGGGIDHETIGVIRLAISVEKVQEDQLSGVVIMLAVAAALSMVALIATLMLSKHFGATVKELAAQLQVVLDNSSALIYMKDVKGCYQFVNKTWLELFDKSLEDVIGKNDHDLFPKDVAPLLTENDRTVLVSGKPLNFEEQTVLKDGHHYYRSVKVPIYDPAGNIYGLCGISTDISDLKRSTDELRKTNNMFSMFMRYSPVYVFIKEVTPASSRVLQASENFAEMVGIAGSNMIGKTMEELFPPEFAAKITADDRDVIVKGDVLKIDEELDGRSYTTFKFPLVQGDTTLLAGFTIDITDRKLAEEELLYSTSLANAALESTPDAILIVDREGKIARWNHKFIDLWRVPPHLLDRTVKDPVLEHVAAQMARPEEFLVKVMELYDHPEESSEDTLYLADGRIFERYSQPQRVGEEITGRFWSFRDITGRKRAEQVLQLSEQKFSTIFNLMPDMVGITRVEDGCFIEVNDGFELGTGWPREEALGKSSLDLGVWTSESRAEAVAILQKQGHLKEFEFTLRKKSGEQRAALMYLLPIVIHEQKCLFFLARDVTELKRAVEERVDVEKQLLHAQKLESLGVLAGGIAHDFNNLLMAIMGNADLALMRLNPESPAVDNLKRIEQASARAADLAKQMLAYSGKGKFVVEHLDMSRLLEEMLHMLEVSISKKAVLRFNLMHPIPSVEADATQMRQIVMNLVINASEAIGDTSGVIAITTGCMDCDRNYLKDVWLDENITAGLYVFLEIADSGCGMNKATMTKLFDPFFTTKFTGRGLGMAAVLGIVRGHKGAIKVYSEPNKGTTFKILLPASDRPAELFNGHTHTDDWKGSGKVLLVDDEETVRGIGREMLQELGFTVITADDGREGVHSPILLRCQGRQSGTNGAFESRVEYHQKLRPV